MFHLCRHSHSHIHIYIYIYDTPGGRKRSEQTAAFSLAGLKQVSRRLELTGRKAGRLGKESCQKSVKSTSALDPLLGPGRPGEGRTVQATKRRRPG